MKRRNIVMSVLASAAMMLTVASTAYACVVIKGDGTVTAATRNSNKMTGLGATPSATFCTGKGAKTAAAGAAGTTVGFTFAPATFCNASGTNQLSAGDYDVRLRNVNGTPDPSAWTGSDASGSWTQVSGSGCFAPANVGAANNYDLGNLTVVTGSGSGSWTLPSTGLVTNGLTDASIFCVGKFGAGGAAPTATSDGFLAPFRVSTV